MSLMYCLIFLIIVSIICNLLKERREKIDWNESEKDDFFKDQQVKRFRKRIDAWENCHSSQGKLALIPLAILGKEYVAKMTNENKNAIIESIDGQVINMLLAVYTLIVRVDIDNEGGGRDV